MDDSPRHRAGVRLTVAYDGTAFHGFARQARVRTVEAVLGEAIAAVDAGASPLRFASRTDAGVHARGQCVAFDAARELPEKGWRMLLNRALPDDVSVRGVTPCDVGYTPRFDSLGKQYRYQIYLGVARDPVRERYAMHVGPTLAHDGRRAGPPSSWLDRDAMREASAALLGTHDFRAFRSADDERISTTRTLRRLELVEDPLDDAAFTFVVEGNAFMKNMVRILVGTLVDVGRGKLAPAQVGALLGPQADRREAGFTAPAHGLCLEWVALGRLALEGRNSSPSPVGNPPDED